MTTSSAVSKVRVFPLLILPVILLIAVGVRFYGLGEESLWLDEIETVRLVNLPFSEMMHYITHADSHPPLFSLIMHVWCRVAGSSDFAVRFWSAVFGSLTVWLAYLIGATLFERSVGLTAALLLALSPFHVYYSQEARMYALLCLLSAGMMFVLWQVTIDGRPRQRILLALLSIAALYTQNIAIFLMVLMNIWYIISHRHQRTSLRNWIIMNGIIFLAYVPWLIGLYHQLGATRDIGFLSWIQAPTLAHLFEVLLEFCGAFPLHAEAEPTVWYFLTSGILFLLFIVCTMTSMVSIFRRASTRTISQPPGQQSCENQQTIPHLQNDSTNESLEHLNSAYLLLWLAVPVLAPFLLSLVLVPLFLARVCIPALVPAFLIIAAGLHQLSKHIPTRKILACAVIASIGSLGLYFQLPVKSDWRGASALLARDSAPDDLILHYPPYLERSIKHYLTRRDVTIAPFPLDASDSEQFRRRLTAVLGSRARFWLVTAYLRENPEEIAKSLMSWFPKQQRKDVPGIAIFELQR